MYATDPTPKHTHTHSALIVGRLLVGLGIGASAIVVPAYLAEIAPAKNRGMVVQMYEVGRVCVISQSVGELGGWVASEVASCPCACVPAPAQQSHMPHARHTNR